MVRKQTNSFAQESVKSWINCFHFTEISSDLCTLFGWLRFSEADCSTFSVQWNKEQWNLEYG